jgi:hypothetical protein
MKKREADFGKQFRAWVRAQKDLPSAAFELKQTTIDYISFSALQDHQEAALLAATTTGLLYKAPDDSRGVKPFDFFYLKRVPAFVVIKYPNGFEGITIENFIAEREKSNRKSLTHAKASEISSFSG